MIKLLQKVLGLKTKQEKDIAALQPFVQAATQQYAQLRSLTDDELRAATATLRQQLLDATAPIRQAMQELTAKADELRTSGDTTQQEEVFKKLDDLKKARNQRLEEELATIAPRAFAIVKETSRRLTENKQLVVTATDWDLKLAATKKNVQIQGGQAVWSNKWNVAGHDLEWNMIHYDVQLMGGKTLQDGKIAEMATGEGKTLVSTLAVFLNALTGLGVHLVTVNDYLAKRDQEWNAPLFEFHGISVDCIDKHEPNSNERRAAYLADITYGTNNEFGFDYLRDNMVTHPDHLVQREHHYAIVDEVDSVLVDEARTPLIISGPVPKGDQHEFNELKPRIEKLVREQQNVINKSLNRARQLIKEGNTKEAMLPLYRAHRGLPKYRPLIKFLSEEGVREVFDKGEAYYNQEKGKYLPEVDEELYFVIEEKNNQIDLTERGVETITRDYLDERLAVIRPQYKKDAPVAEQRPLRLALNELLQFKALYTLKEISEGGLDPATRQSRARLVRDLMAQANEIEVDSKLPQVAVADADMLAALDRVVQQPPRSDKDKNKKTDDEKLVARYVEAREEQLREKEFFVLPDVNLALHALDNDRSLSAEERLRHKEGIARSFAEKSERLHSLQQLLRAYSLYERDVEYIVDGGKVMIVDEHTGRILAGRRYSDGLHQAIEAKENVKVEAVTQTFATITLQNYFRMYHKLAGMTGTAETEAGELYQIYKLDVVVIPTNRAIIRKDYDDKVYRTMKEKFNAIIDEVQHLSLDEGRPVLVGTTSVEVSELLSRMMTLRKIKHNVLNAKQHAREAEIVAEAGLSGTVTIATNMAGRGTDIKLGPGVKEKGGLAIIGTERHESRRIDRQLRGRAGRQGDPGTSQFYVSLEDNLMRMFGSERISKVMRWMKVPEGEVIQHSVITNSITKAQKKVEENNFGIRKRLLEYDDVMNKQREVIYTRRRNALFGERLRVDLDAMTWDYCEYLVGLHHEAKDADALQMDCLRYLAIDPGFSQQDLDEKSAAVLTEQLYQLATETYARRTNNLKEIIYQGALSNQEVLKQYRYMEVMLQDGNKAMRMLADIPRMFDTQGEDVVYQLEKSLVLEIIDEHWKEHLREMDDLKQSVQTASFEQKDPLMVYKFEAYEIFEKMLMEVNRETLGFLYRVELAGERQTNQEQQVKRDDFSKMKAQHTDSPEPQRAQRAPSAVPLPNGAERPISRAERRAMERDQEKKKK